MAGSILSSPIVNAAKYQKLLKVEEGEFTEDIKQISYDQIPLLDRDSASILGNRKMGSLVDMASQFEVSELYSQINYKGEPVRVTPLRYADTIKWLTNQKEGIPAYIKIDMATQDTELVRLSEGMKYTPYDHFHRNLKRHLRFRYPTYISMISVLRLMRRVRLTGFAVLQIIRLVCLEVRPSAELCFVML